jgi:UDP-glucose 4-epimerase
VKEILIIGANGYIGARLSSLLANSGYNVTALCFPKIPSDDNWRKQMKELIVGDITFIETIKQITSKKYDVAIHLVSLDHHQSNQEPNLVNSVNVMPVWNLLEAFKRKSTLSKFIYFSTIHVYGPLPLEAIDETYTPNPQLPYALTHLLAENICNYYNDTSNINCVNLRLSNSYGRPCFEDNNCWWLVVNDFCRSAFFEKRIVLRSNGSALRDFIHYKDIFNAIQILIDSKKDISANNTFNLSSEKAYSIYQLAEIIKQVYFERYLIHIPIEMPTGIKVNQLKKEKLYILSNSKLQSMGFKQEVDIEYGILELFNYFESHE